MFDCGKLCSSNKHFVAGWNEFRRPHSSAKYRKYVRRFPGNLVCPSFPHIEADWTAVTDLYGKKSPPSLSTQARWDPMQNTHWRLSWKKHLRIFLVNFLIFFQSLNWTFSNQLMDKEVKENSAICSCAISKSFAMPFPIFSTGREHNCEINSSCWRKEKVCKSQD